ncbi:MAG: winged helix-turn-helix domain-containing protein [Shewanella sp.]
MISYTIADSIIFQPLKFRLVINENTTIKLSQKEAEVLHLLCQTPQHVVMRKLFLETIWNNRESGDVHLNKCILTLRRKFESQGHMNSIDTVPRIGYLLRLSVETHPTELNTINDGSVMITNHRPSYIVKNILQGKSILPILLTVLAPIAYSVYKFNDGDINKHIRYTERYTTPSLNIIEMNNVTYSVDINELVSKYYSTIKTYLSLSNLAMTIAKESNDDKYPPMIYIIDHQQDINKQLLCFAEYASKIPENSNKWQHETDHDHTKQNGTAFQKRLFYSSCANNSAKYVGTLTTRVSYYSRQLPKKDVPSSWLQHSYFNDKHGELAFDLQQIYRANHIIKNENNSDFLVKLEQKSIKLNYIDQDKIDNDIYIKLIENEYESDYIYAKSLKYSPGEDLIMLSSIFDGTLTKARL